MKSELTDEPTWIVDPIDGTTNFVHGIPCSCISIGICVDKVPVIGVVLNPFLNTIYTAIKGQGAYKNGTKLPLNKTQLGGINSCVFVTEWGTSRKGINFDIKRETFSTLLAEECNGGKMVHGLRMNGSAALNLCGVAEGVYDGYWECGPWE